MTWTLIDSTTERDATLELYGKDGRFMIRANGLELMNGFHHDSETALGLIAADMARQARPRVLVGGLGLGYTLAALLQALGNAGSVTVAELSATVIDWFQRYMEASVLPRSGANPSIVHADIRSVLVGQGRYDVVVLDVDNGPEALVTADNAALYSANGLRALHDCLSGSGVALLWSGFESADFAARAEQAGFTVTCELFQRGRAALAHYIYVLAKTAPA